MDITQLVGAPELTEAIGGREYGFGELTLEHRARLQAWIRKATPDPWDDAVRRCRGLPEAVQAAILDSARKESLKWPPRLGTAAGSQALLGTEEGQVETFYEALSIHQPGTTREDARAVYSALNRHPDGEEMADRILRVVFGRPRRSEEPDAPKA